MIHASAPAPASPPATLAKSLLAFPELNAPVLQAGTLEQFNHFKGDVVLVSHPAYWRIANKKVSGICRDVYKRFSRMTPTEREFAIKRDMLASCYGKGFFFEAQFELTLARAKNEKRPVLISQGTVDDQSLGLPGKNAGFLAPYLNWCFDQYSIGNIFLVPTKNGKGDIVSDNIRNAALQGCDPRKVILHGGIIDGFLLETARDLFADKIPQGGVELNDNFCYSKANAHIPFPHLKSDVYFNRGVEAWGAMGVTPEGASRSNETMAFHEALPKISIVY